MIVDLHTHTNASDGALTPHDLLQQAALAGVELLSITDHDTLAAYLALPASGGGALRLVPGIEFSTMWHEIGVHVLGLNIDPAGAAIRSGIAQQQRARLLRAECIAARLEQCGVADALAGALAIAGPSTVGRPHFAQYLVNAEVVKNTAQAFKRYLGRGKAGDVKQYWAPLGQVIEWIRDSGGTAVLAHPAKYGLTRSQRIKLIEAFRLLGGQAIEVISGRQDPMLTQSLAANASASKLLAAVGSDFHEPCQPWARLGMPLTLPPRCRPVWDSW